MGLLKRVFAGPDQVGAVIDGARKGLDALVFTNEERAAQGIRAFELVADYMRATEGQNLARRLIAFAVVGLWAFVIVLGVALALLQNALGWESDPAGIVFGVLEDHVTWPLGIVLGFYFATHLLRAYQKPPKD